MVTRTLPISDIVEVTTVVSPRRQAVTDRRTLFLTRDSTQDAGGEGKVRSYDNLADVGKVFSTNSEPYRFAQTYFAGRPFPKTLVVGRWAEALQNTEVRGGAPADVGDISGAAVSNGSFAIAGEDVTGIAFAQNATYTQIATAVQTALRNVTAFGATATCTYLNGRFTIGLPPTVSISAVAVNASAGTALAEKLGLDTTSGATLHLGSAAETIAAALDTCTAMDAAIYFITLESQLNDTASMVAASTWAQSKRVFLSLESQAASSANAVVAPSREGLVAVAPRRTLMTNTATKDYKGGAAVSRLSAVNYESPNSVATLKFKTMYNTTPDNYDGADVAALNGKHINYYVRYGGDPIYAEGQMMSGDWADEVAWQDWFTTAVERAVFDLMRRTPKIPYTRVGIQRLKTVVEEPCRQGVNNGGLAPNEVSEEFAAIIRDTTRDPNFDGYLSTGYIIYVTPVGMASQTQRDNRVIESFQIFGKGAGAIHGLSALFNFER